jgi:hypothetical protein
MGQLKELTLQMARAVVNNAEQVKVEEVEGASMIVLELTVDPRIWDGSSGKEAGWQTQCGRSYAPALPKMVNESI